MPPLRIPREQCCSYLPESHVSCVQPARVRFRSTFVAIAQLLMPWCARIRWSNYLRLVESNSSYALATVKEKSGGLDAIREEASTIARDHYSAAFFRVLGGDPKDTTQPGGRAQMSSRASSKVIRQLRPVVVWLGIWAHPIWQSMWVLMAVAFSSTAFAINSSLTRERGDSVAARSTNALITIMMRQRSAPSRWRKGDAHAASADTAT